jgi:hypothetical protein
LLACFKMKGCWRRASGLGRTFASLHKHAATKEQNSGENWSAGSVGGDELTTKLNRAKKGIGCPVMRLQSLKKEKKKKSANKRK